MYDTAAVVALREDIARDAVSVSEVLHDEVDAVVDEMKTAGWPPERVVIAVKQIADDAGVKPSVAVLSRVLPLTDTDVVLTQVVRWSIARYYSSNDGSISRAAEENRREFGRMKSHGPTDARV